MGWTCTRCGDVNAGTNGTCQECGSSPSTSAPPRMGLQPIPANLVWLATLLGGGLAGFGLVAWNSFLVTRNRIVGAVYIFSGVAVWLICILALSKMTLAYGVIGGLALSFLVVSIPHNRDSLSVNQWHWSHPNRRLILALGLNGKVARPRLVYSSFTPESAGLAQEQATPGRVFGLPAVPLAVVVISGIMGALTILIGTSLAT